MSHFTLCSESQGRKKCHEFGEGWLVGLWWVEETCFSPSNLLAFLYFLTGWEKAREKGLTVSVSRKFTVLVVVKNVHRGRSFSTQNTLPNEHRKGKKWLIIITREGKKFQTPKEFFQDYLQLNHFSLYNSLLICFLYRDDSDKRLLQHNIFESRGEWILSAKQVLSDRETFINYSTG